MYGSWAAPANGGHIARQLALEESRADLSDLAAPGVTETFTDLVFDPEILEALARDG